MKNLSIEGVKTLAEDMAILAINKELEDKENEEIKYFRRTSKRSKSYKEDKKKKVKVIINKINNNKKKRSSITNTQINLGFSKLILTPSIPENKIKTIEESDEFSKEEQKKEKINTPIIFYPELDSSKRENNNKPKIKEKEGINIFVEKNDYTDIYINPIYYKNNDINNSVLRFKEKKEINNSFMSNKKNQESFLEDENELSTSFRVTKFEKKIPIYERGIKYQKYLLLKKNKFKRLKKEKEKEKYIFKENEQRISKITKIFNSKAENQKPLYYRAKDIHKKHLAQIKLYQNKKEISQNKKVSKKKFDEEKWNKFLRKEYEFKEKKLNKTKSFEIMKNNMEFKKANENNQNIFRKLNNNNSRSIDNIFSKLYNNFEQHKKIPKQKKTDLAPTHRSINNKSKKKSLKRQLNKYKDITIMLESSQKNKGKKKDKEKKFNYSFITGNKIETNNDNKNKLIARKLLLNQQKYKTKKKYLELPLITANLSINNNNTQRNKSLNFSNSINKKIKKNKIRIFDSSFCRGEQVEVNVHPISLKYVGLKYSNNK